MLTEADATLLSRMRGTPWPDPKDHPLPAPLEARSSAAKLLASGVFALVLAGMFAIMLRENAQTAEAYEGWRLWLRVFVVLGMAGLGLMILAAGVGAIRSRAPLVSLQPAGLLIPSLYRSAIPWSDIELVVHDRPRVKLLGPGRIVMAVRSGGRLGRVVSQDLKAASDPGGLDAAQLPQILNVPVEHLFARIQSYRAHFGRGGEASAAE